MGCSGKAAYGISGEAVRAGFIHPGGDKGPSNHCLPLTERDRMDDGLRLCQEFAAQTQGSGHALQQGKFILFVYGKISSD